MGTAGPKTKIIAAVSNPATVRRSPIPAFHELAEQRRFKIKAILVVTAGNNTGVFGAGLELGKGSVQTLAHSWRVIDEAIGHSNVQHYAATIVGGQHSDAAKI